MYFSNLIVEETRCIQPAMDLLNSIKHGKLISPQFLLYQLCTLTPGCMLGPKSEIDRLIGSLETEERQRDSRDEADIPPCEATENSSRVLEDG